MPALPSALFYTVELTLINVLSSDVVIACGMGAGTASEIAIALKEKKPVLLLAATNPQIEFFQSLGAVETVESIEQAIEWVQTKLRP